jgi:DNA-binding transcriptional MerR regulator
MQFIDKETGREIEEWWKPGNTSDGEDFTIEDIGEYLSAKSIVASRLIWNALISTTLNAKEAWYYASARVRNLNDTRHYESLLVSVLKNVAWVPNRAGNFCYPRQLTKKDLRSDFIFRDDNGLLTAIGFGDDAKKATAEYAEKAKVLSSFGVSVEEMERILEWKKSGHTIEELRDATQAKNSESQRQFPDRSSPNPNRRAEKVAEASVSEAERSHEVRPRSVSIVGDEKERAKQYLATQYTDAESDDKMSCQLCGATVSESPFKTTDGKWHFESVPFLPTLRTKTHPQNFLCCCHNHAAMLSFHSDAEFSKLEAVIRDWQDDAARCLPIELLGKPHSLWFTREHLRDLQTLLRTSAPDTPVAETKQ